MTDRARRVQATLVGGIALSTFRSLPEWDGACDRLRVLYERHGASAEKAAAEYAAVYQHQRAAMVFDVVYSARRNYVTHVKPKVREFLETEGSKSIRALAETGTNTVSGRRAQGMRDVAAGLLRFGSDAGVEDDDELCLRWAHQADVGLAYELDPYLGNVNGIGLALFHYLRMRCGADTLKPDVRVGTALKDGLGFPLKAGSSRAVFAMGLGAAAECGIRPIVLDQLLWDSE